MHEFLHLLLTKIEMERKGTCVENELLKLFSGKVATSIECRDIPCISSNIETFYDVQLHIMGKMSKSPRSPAFYLGSFWHDLHYSLRMFERLREAGNTRWR